MKGTLTVRIVMAAVCLALGSSNVSAQIFGTFTWQMQPYCNKVTLTLTSLTGNLTLDGSEDQCGTTNRASAIGVATFNAVGNVTLNFTIITAPSAKPVHVSAIVSPADGSGIWTDSVGNSGTFAFFGAVPGLPTRPLPPSGVAPATITAIEIAAGAVGASAIAAGAVRASQLGTITNRIGVSAVIANNDSGSATASCLDGEQVLSGGYDGAYAAGYFVFSSRREGNGWRVSLSNYTGGLTFIIVHAYCLAP